MLFRSGVEMEITDQNRLLQRLMQNTVDILNGFRSKGAVGDRNLSPLVFCAYLLPLFCQCIVKALNRVGVQIFQSNSAQSRLDVYVPLSMAAVASRSFWETSFCVLPVMERCICFPVPGSTPAV